MDSVPDIQFDASILKKKVLLLRAAHRKSRRLRIWVCGLRGPSFSHDAARMMGFQAELSAGAYHVVIIVYSSSSSIIILPMD